ncbi:MAG: type II methionyl aminopeptidase [Desulfurococcales archaeon]|nr:type II methionyl aminopeptidase [Desulfurococcales archaeon]
MALDEEAVEKLVKAGEIAARTRELGARLVREGSRASEVCSRLEEYIVENGARPAFPCNFSVNHVAAHYTPGVSDDVVVKEGDIVKVDVGVSIDGFIADTAVTVDVGGSHEGLVRASEEALDAVVRLMRPRIRIYEIGKAIEPVVKRRGFRVIRNLAGHTIGRYTIHAGTSIPNYPERKSFYARIEPGTVVAIEPFATNGRGYVVEGGPVNIYAYTGKKPRIPLNELETEILEHVREEYRTLPFTPRWLARRWRPEEVVEALKSLASKGVLHAYPVLVESGRGLVSQAEHTFVVLKDRVIATTCPECGQ